MPGTNQPDTDIRPHDSKISDVKEQLFERLAGTLGSFSPPSNVEYEDTQEADWCMECSAPAKENCQHH